MSREFRPLRILITNNTLAYRAGSEMYVRDLAIALMKRGHFPVAYSPVLGQVADELRDHTIPVIDDLGVMDAAPDIIHGHHHHETMTAMMRYPDTPAILVCHGWVPWEEEPFAHPNIMRHVAVDALCRERLLTTRGIEPARVGMIHNFVDCERFGTVRDLPEQPRRALVFSNYANDVPAAIREACEAAGIAEIDIAGSGSGRSIADPGTTLCEYDIVFAKARAAMEAMASGCAVVVTHHAGLAGMVTSERLPALRSLNFGIRTMQSQRLSAETVARELALYDRSDAARVTVWMREHAALDVAVDAWLETYDAALADWPDARSRRSDKDLLRAGSDYLRSLASVLKSARQNAAQSDSARARAERLTAQLQASLARAGEGDRLRAEVRRLEAALEARDGETSGSRPRQQQPDEDAPD
ncbi:glycosyltransferase [Maricaulis sp.]|uniref:glycosyltransferase n=1 Tax=Maricaulis sp. TaxID=1486257 RepID=UPI0025B92BC3|nr:glycosyltransferase [Maricaulis sp.]